MSAVLPLSVAVGGGLDHVPFVPDGVAVWMSLCGCPAVRPDGVAVFLPSGCPAVVRPLSGWCADVLQRFISFVGSKDCKGMKSNLYVRLSVVWND